MPTRYPREQMHRIRYTNFIDGPPLPDNPTPGWNGYSIARWEGDTLVVQTAGFRDNLWIDTGGSPMSDAAKMTERMQRSRTPAK